MNKPAASPAKEIPPAGQEALRRSRRPDRLVLSFLGLGLAAMLIVSVVHRLGGDPLARREASSSRSSARGMPENMPPAMAEALAGRQSETQGGPAAMRGLADDSERQTAMIEQMRRLQADPNDVDALLELADLFMTDNPASARAFLDRAMVAAPSDPRPSYHLGVLLSGQGRHQEAADAMERSLTLGDHPATRYSLAVILRYYLQRPDEARRHLQAALASPELSPELRSLTEAELAR